MLKISVIIPVYNVEIYLEKCVNSIINQSYKNIEIILVDDGSTDNSSKICDNLAAIDDRIIVIHKDNGGLSDARNCGVKRATGDYIVFIDSDDFWQNNENLKDIVDEVLKTPECDFIGFNVSYYYPSTEKFVDWVLYDKEIEMPIKTELCIPLLVKSGTFPMSACSKIIKRSLLKDIPFIKGITSEDIPWFIALLEKAKYCRFVNKYIYAYRQEVSNSISSSYSDKKFLNLYTIMMEGINGISPLWSTSAREALLSFWAYELCILKGMTGYMDKKEGRKWRNILKQYNWLLRYRLNPKVRICNFVYTFLGNRVLDFLLMRFIRRRM